MKNLPIFADKIRFWPFKVLSQKAARSFLIRKSGAVVPAFTYRNDLSGTRKRLLVLPSRLSRLSIFIPFLLEIADGAKREDLAFLSPDGFHPLLKALGMDSMGIFYQPSMLRYGQEAFQALDHSLRQRAFEVVIMLEGAPSLPLQFLARASGAPIRIGFECEADYPFLNLSFRSGKTISAFRTHLESLFRIRTVNRKHPLAHHSEHLSSQHVILLNLEPSIQGHSWNADELTQLSRSLDPRFRLLALAPDPALIEPFAALLERLAIRIAPIASSYSGFLDLLRQYCGLVTLNSEHAQLAMHVSQVPTILINEPELDIWLPEDCPDVHVVNRQKPFPDHIFRVLTTPSRT